ncbi:MAG: M50 family metallopeptidase [Sporichthyaceae bacterium]|nr:M50 family metallopeptidase [Sporichthyaceae bacterium]
MIWWIAGVLAFFVIILLSIVLHEAGHFLTAKLFGMKATEFFVGFGKRLWSFRRGETEYGIKAIPAGGYVRIVGMSDLEEVPAQDRPRAFYRQKAWKRLIVLGSGSAMHIVIAFVMLVGLGLFTNQYRETLTVGTVSECVSNLSSEECPVGAPASPAARAGLQVGDRAVSIDGHQVASWSELVERIRSAQDATVTLVVDRGGQLLTLSPDLVVRTVPAEDGNGETRQGYLGVSTQPEAYKLGFVGSVDYSASAIGEAVRLTGVALARIPSGIGNIIDATFLGGERDPEGMVGVVGIARISGDTFAAEEDPAGSRITQFLFMMALLNVFIGIFNLLPLPPLDGGHIFLLLIERTRAAIYKLIRRPDPGHIDPSKAIPIAYVFIVVLVALTALLAAADVINPVKLPT